MKKLKAQNLKLKTVFFGTSEFAVPILKSLVTCHMLPVTIVTEPDKPAGRGEKLTPSPIKLLAQKHNIPALQPERVVDISSELKAQGPELFIAAAYGQILPQDILDIPRYGCLNIHPSLLPKYRGPSPIQKSILDGKKKTGVTIIKMDEKMDHGLIVAQKTLEIENNDTTKSLSQKLSNLGAELLIEIITKYTSGELKPIPQDNKKATYTKLIKKEDGKIDWNKPAEQIEREIRAYYPWPGSYSYWKQETKNKKQKTKKLIKITEANVLDTQNNKPGYVFLSSDKKLVISCKLGSLEIKKLQLEGKKEMTTEEFLNGYPKIIGSVLK